MLTATDPDSTYTFTYDALNRLHTVDNAGTPGAPNVVLTYGYDAQGNVVLTQDNAGVTVESQYDPRNRLEWRKWFDADIPGASGETADVDPARVDFLYNAAGREALVSRYADLDATQLVGTTTRTYDTASRSDLLTHRNAAGDLLAGYDYDYDFAGLLTHEARTHQDAQFAQSIDYVYDLTGQLTDALFDPARTMSTTCMTPTATGCHLASVHGRADLHHRPPPTNSKPTASSATNTTAKAARSSGST